MAYANILSGCFSLHREPYASHLIVPQPFHIYGWVYSFRHLVESYPVPSPSIHGGGGVFFPGNAPPSDTVDSESVVGVKPGDFGVLIRQQVNEFTCTWLAENFIA